MGSPMRFEKDLNEYGYHMEVDIKKDDCNRERTVHWHLCKNGRRIAQIWVPSVTWESRPDVSKSIREEAENLTRRYSSDITRAYINNQEYGAE